MLIGKSTHMPRLVAEFKVQTLHSRCSPSPAFSARQQRVAMVTTTIISSCSKTITRSSLRARRSKRHTTRPCSSTRGGSSSPSCIKMETMVCAQASNTIAMAVTDLQKVAATQMFPARNTNSTIQMGAVMARMAAL